MAQCVGLNMRFKELMNMKIILIVFVFSFLIIMSCTGETLEERYLEAQMQESSWHGATLNITANVIATLNEDGIGLIRIISTDDVVENIHIRYNRSNNIPVKYLPAMLPSRGIIQVLVSVHREIQIGDTVFGRLIAIRFCPSEINKLKDCNTKWLIRWKELAIVSIL